MGVFPPASLVHSRPNHSKAASSCLQSSVPKGPSSAIQRLLGKAMRYIKLHTIQADGPWLRNSSLVQCRIDVKEAACFASLKMSRQR
ncbi:hypothetical protein LZ30DRAFT_733930 [Colletotrichum cereale]|nr:hypothetical protein LZ30DRAFT_733930 [Colletotrichum cereale]